MDDRNVPGYPRSRVALRQDRAAGDQAWRLGLAPLLRITDLEGALAKGKGVPCGEAEGSGAPPATRPWRLPW